MLPRTGAWAGPNERLVAEQFASDVAGHQMTVLHEAGLYRHIRYATPGTGMYSFDLVTFPGHLVVTGDMGTFTFARLPDMFEFFRASAHVNVAYWAQKATSFDRHGPGSGREYTAAAARAWLTGRFNSTGRGPEPARTLLDRLLQAADSEYELREALADADDADWLEGHPEEDFTEPAWHLVWVLYAIRYGISLYDQHTTTHQENMMTTTTTPTTTGATFHRRPVDVQAMRLDGNGAAMTAWLHTLGYDSSAHRSQEGQLLFLAIGGLFVLHAGHWLVRLPGGRLTKLSPSQFADDYQPGAGDE